GCPPPAPPAPSGTGTGTSAPSACGSPRASGWRPARPSSFSSKANWFATQSNLAFRGRCVKPIPAGVPVVCRRVVPSRRGRRGERLTGRAGRRGQGKGEAQDRRETAEGEEHGVSPATARDELQRGELLPSPAIRARTEA